jgi:UDP-N-acetylmuramoylalanine--D-glutamate ligase
MLVVGLARSGVAAALSLRARGEAVIGVDAGPGVGADQLADAGVELHLRSDGAGLLERAGSVIKSPGVPAQDPLISAAVERGLPVLGELELAWRLLPNEFIAVTGTNGKTTTVELIGHIHREAGVPSAVAGNVGIPASSLVGSINPDATVVCEASSFQLEDTLDFAPEAAVLLNLAEDHLDRHATMEAYLTAKLQIFACQDAWDIAVLPASFQSGYEMSETGAERSETGGVRSVAGGVLEALQARRVSFGTRPGSTLQARGEELYWQGLPLLALSELPLPGRHNVENAMAAAAVCLARGIDRDAVRAGLRSFRGVPHRLEEVARRGGVVYVNDSKATNVTSTLVALSAFADGALAPRSSETRSASKPVHLIAGGQGKGQDFSLLREPVERSCAAVYLIGEDAPAIAEALTGADTRLRVCGELDRAIGEAARASAPGEVILLSPACASFDQFADFEARGDRFRELVSSSGASAPNYLR